MLHFIIYFLKNINSTRTLASFFLISLFSLFLIISSFLMVYKIIQEYMKKYRDKLRWYLFPLERIYVCLWEVVWIDLVKINPGENGWSWLGFSLCNCLFIYQFSSLSCVRLFATPWIAACQASLSITNSWSLLKLMPVRSVMPSSHLILCHPLLLLPPVPPSIRVFSIESTFCMRWPKYWSFSFSISLSNEHPGLISFRMDWLDLLAVQGTLKSLLQHHS